MSELVKLAMILVIAGSAGASRSSIECDSAIDCLALWPASGAPNEKPGEVGPESRAGNDGHGCGPLRNIDCDHRTGVGGGENQVFEVLS